MVTFFERVARVRSSWFFTTILLPLINASKKEKNLKTYEERIIF